VILAVRGEEFTEHGKQGHPKQLFDDVARAGRLPEMPGLDILPLAQRGALSGQAAMLESHAGGQHQRAAGIDDETRERLRRLGQLEGAERE
jgi:hypothetical protein